MTESPLPICDYEGSDYQDRFWEHGDRANEDGAEAAKLPADSGLVSTEARRNLRLGEAIPKELVDPQAFVDGQVHISVHTTLLSSQRCT